MPLQTCIFNAGYTVSFAKYAARHHGSNGGPPRYPDPTASQQTLQVRASGAVAPVCGGKGGRRWGCRWCVYVRGGGVGGSSLTHAPDAVRVHKPSSSPLCTGSGG